MSALNSPIYQYEILNFSQYESHITPGRAGGLICEPLKAA